MPTKAKPKAKALAKAKSPVFEAVHETATDLFEMGFIDQHKMRKFELLCQAPIPVSGGALRA